MPENVRRAQFPSPRQSPVIEPKSTLMLTKIKTVVSRAVSDIMNNHTMAISAGLSYYFVMSLFPLLILLATVLAVLPFPHLFDNIIGSLGRVVPPDSMGVVRAVLKDIISPNVGKFFTVGLLGTIWSATGGFSALLEALNVAYDVPETRPYWETRFVIPFLMMVVTGGLMTLGVLVMFVGPEFGNWLNRHSDDVGPVFAQSWPILKWVLSTAFLVLGVELIFFWGPNVKQRFKATLPGAILGVGFWIGTSYLLGLYFQHFANFNKTYGTLGAAIALMVWLYWSWFMILVGAEVNSELLKASAKGRLALKKPPPEVIRTRPAWVEEKLPPEMQLPRGTAVQEKLDQKKKQEDKEAA